MSAEGNGRRVVIVGGGVIGLACAWFLTRAGWQVAVVERGKVGGGSSGGNCGLVCPSHVLPLAEPGMVAQGIKALFTRNAPLKIKPRFDPALWSWFLQFARRCNEKDMITAGHGIQALLESSLELYRTMVETDGLDCEWERKGLLFAYKTAEALDAYTPTDRLMRDTFHCPAHKLDAKALIALEPALRDDLAGGWFYDDDAHLRPDKLLRSWRSALEGQGVDFHEGCVCDHFSNGRSSNPQAGAVVTSTGEFPADLFVVAAGAWTPQLAGAVGIKVPIQPGKGYSLTMPRPAVCPKIPLIFPETRVAVTPFQSGYRLGSTMEFAGYDETIDPSRLELLKNGARPYLKEPYCDPVEDTWYGWRPMTYDGLPVIDRSPAYSNVWLAAGHNMLGLSMAPATGKLLAELVTGSETHIDPSPYRVARFQG
ncbi:MAG: FAD-dependent oxidoreductase [Isosphaeraceae bacterium]